MGWFPDQSGGLNRYFRQLFTALDGGSGAQRGVVVGPASDAPAGLVPASRHGARIARRLYEFATAAGRAGEGMALADVHFALYSAWPVLVGRLRSLPYVVHFQGPWADESHAMGQGGARVVAKRWLEGLVYRRAAHAVVLSSDFKRLLVETYRVPPWRVSVLAPGVDLAAFHPADAAQREELRGRWGVLEPAALILCVRRLVPRTGVGVLLQAWEAVQRALPGSGRSAVLLIGGIGPDQAALAALSAQLQLGDSVRFLGALSEEDLVSAYQAADLTVVPSLALEGFGLVVLESLACGTPVIASDIGGLPDALADLDRSLLVPSGDSAALAERLLGAVTGAGPTPGRPACRQHAEGYSWSEVAAANQAVYSAVVGQSPARPIRIVYLDHCAQLSGGEIALLRLLTATRDRVDAHVVLAEPGPLADRLQAMGVSCAVLPMGEAARDLGRGAVRLSSLPPATLRPTLAYVGRLTQLLRSHRPDLVCTNSLKAAVYGTAAARLAGVPVVWHLRDRIATDYLPEAAVKLVHALSRQASAIIANSAATLATLGPLRHREGTTFMVPDMVGPEQLSLPGAAWPAADDTVVRIGLVGRLAPWKGQELFLDAFARAFPTGLERAVLVGSALFGEEDYEQRLRRQVVKLGLDQRVELRGFRSDIPQELARLTVLAQTSTIPEPFGQTVIEGMAAGLAVIAPDAGGPAEIIRDGVNGVLYPPGDVAALASAMARLVEDDALRARLGAAARVRARDFAPPVIAPQVIEVYEAVCRRRGLASLSRTRTPH